MYLYILIVLYINVITYINFSKFNNNKIVKL